MKSYEDLLLGDSLSTILSEHYKQLPVISEYQFQQEVVDILAKPLDKESLTRYLVYVGELTKPLNVVDNKDREKVLFTVPALVQSPNPSIVNKGGMDVAGLFHALQRDAETGNPNYHKKMQQHLGNMTSVPDYVENVLKPIDDIIEKYGHERLHTKTDTDVVATDTDQESSYLDEYED